MRRVAFRVILEFGHPAARLMTANRNTMPPLMAYAVLRLALAYQTLTRCHQTGCADQLVLLARAWKLSNTLGLAGNRGNIDRLPL